MTTKVSVKVKWNDGNIRGIERNVIVGLFRMGTDIGNQARRNAPYKTGALRNSIRVQKNPEDVEVIAGGTIGSKVIPYAAIQEFGGRAGRNHSVNIIGRHYMQRATDFIMSGNYMKKYFGDISK